MLRFYRKDGIQYDKVVKKQIEDVCTVTNGKGNTQDKIDGGEYPFYVRSATVERSNKYLFDKEAVITSGDGVGVGKIYHYVNGKFNLHQRCYACFDFNSIDCKYFYHYLSSKFYKRVMSLSAKGSVDSVRLNFITKMPIHVPCMEEQQKIADCLSSVDELIADYEAQVENMQNQKKGVMQKLFSQEIRFKADDGSDFPDWEKKSLKDISERINRKNRNNETDIPLTISSKYGLVDQRTYFNKAIASKDMSNYYLLEKGEFAYNRSYSLGYDYGTIKRLEHYEQGALSTLYICFSVDSRLNQTYMSFLFDSSVWYKEAYKVCAEGARNHGLLNISAKDFFSITINIAKDIREQQKIADCLTAFDNAIEDLQKTAEHWKNIKKGLLQQLFDWEGVYDG